MISSPRWVIRAALLAFALALGTSGAAAQQAGLREAMTEANITRLAAGVLGSSQLAHKPLDGTLADALLEHYLDALDPDRMLFLVADAQELTGEGARLARDTLRTGDTRLAHLVFERFLERLRARARYVERTLADASFEFTGDEHYALDRESAARPHSLDEARALWRERLRFEYLQEKLGDREPAAIAGTLEGRYARGLERMEQLGRSEVLAVYLSAMARAYDPHSDYLGHSELDNFQISMNLSLFGIGAKLQSVDGRCRIVELIPGGPASRSGQLGPGDHIVAVAQGDGAPVDVIDMPLARIVELIRGPKGTVVELTVVSAGEGENGARRQVRIERDEIRLEERRAKARIVDLPHGARETVRLGIVEVPSFYSSVAGAMGGSTAAVTEEASATTDVARLLRKLAAEDVQGVLLDLRRNGGGSLTEAISLTGLFIAEGPVVQTRGVRGTVQVVADPDSAVHYSGPLVVLTSRFSASASEILAGALQDYGRALIVGDPSTYGKGTVQSLVPLAPMMDRAGLDYAYDPGALKVTIRKFYRPGGASTQVRGVAADIVVPSPSALSFEGEAGLDNPLPWDAVAPARFERYAAVQPYLPALRAASARRVREDAAFVQLRAELERIRERLDAGRVSLNEAERRREMARLEARREELLRALDAIGARGAVVYEIPVSAAERPGLPPPFEAPAQDASGPPAASGAPADDVAGAPAVHDLVLLEAQRILADYLALHARERAPAVPERLRATAGDR